MAHEDEFNPEDFPAIPEELIANEEEQLMTYAGEEEVLDVTSQFLNIEGAEIGHQVFSALRNGETDPFKVLIMIKKMQHLHDFFMGTSADARTNKVAKEWLKDKITNEIGRTEYRAFGASVKIEGIGGATTMDYKGCGDLILDRLYDLQKQMNQLVKDREKFIKDNLPAESNTIGLRSLKCEMSSFPSIEWAEIEPQFYNINPPVKYSREGIVVRFPKKKK